MILLTGGEFHNLHEEFFGEGSGSCCEIDDTDLCFRVAKAQLGKVVEWGNEECLEYSNDFISIKRRECSHCWQTLLKEIE